MAAQIAPDRAAHAGHAHADEPSSRSDDVAYFALYIAIRGTITHHRQRACSRELNAYFALLIAGDRLILRPVGTKQEVVWERFK